MRVIPGDAVALTRALVAIDSRNPSLVPGATGELAVATALAGILGEWGFAIEMQEVAPGRPNVIARLGDDARSGGQSLMFNGHLDVVGVEGMVHEPWNPVDRDGRMFGRGSSDMKGGVAAMCAAAWRARDAIGDGQLIIAAVVDEEYQSLGTRGLVEAGVRAGAAIVTEPTSLAIMPAHRGFVWIDVLVHGRAAHGSRWEIGIDAIRHAGLLLAELDELDAAELPARPGHPLLGRPSIHASLIEGGTGMSTYPDRCLVRLERRTLPGETVAGVRLEIERACERVRQRRPEFSAEITLGLAQNPSDVAPDAPICRALQGAIADSGGATRYEGMSAWTDAAILNDAGIPAICYGPGDIGVAHAAEEFITVREIEDATAVLARLASQWCQGGGSRAWPS